MISSNDAANDSNSGKVRERLVRTVIHLLSILARYSGFLRLYSWSGKRAETNRFKILMYHRVIGEKYDSRDPSQAGLAVEQDSFDRQMEYLKRHYDVIPLERLVRCLRGEGRRKDC